MAFNFTSKDKGIASRGNLAGQIGPSSQGAQSSLDSGVSSYGRLSRPQLAAASNASYSGGLLQGTPRVTTGATTYAGVDPASIQLDAFRQNGTSAIKQQIDAQNAGAMALNSKAKASNDFAKLIDEYNNKLATYRSDLVFGNPSDIENMPGSNVFKGANTGTFYQDGYNGYYFDDAKRNALSDSSKALHDAIRAMDIPADASPEFKAYAKKVKASGNPETWGVSGLKSYMGDLVGAGAMNARFNPAEAELELTDATGRYTMGVFDNSQLSDTYSDYSFGGVGLNGRLAAIGAMDPKGDLGFGIGFGQTVAQAVYNPWMDMAYNKYWNFDFGASPDAPYLKTGYGGRFTRGKSGDAPEQFTSRDLSAEVSPYQDTMEYLGETPYPKLQGNQREYFNREPQVPVAVKSVNQNQAPVLTGGYSQSLRSTANVFPSIQYQTYAAGSIPSNVANSIYGVTDSRGRSYAGDDVDVQFPGSRLDSFGRPNPVTVKSKSSGSTLAQIPPNDFRYISGGYQ